MTWSSSKKAIVISIAQPTFIALTLLNKLTSDGATKKWRKEREETFHSYQPQQPGLRHINIMCHLCLALCGSTVGQPETG
jgi:hypothetical protein